MNTPHPASQRPAAYRLCFSACHAGARTFDFPCDAEGHVDLDRLSERARNDYLFARVVVKAVRAQPTVRRIQ